MADVFISYHEKSAGELAEQIADALDAAGIFCWCARRDMLFGGNFAREIPSQIHACRLFLLILNESVYHSEHIENEVGIAFSRLNKKENIRILPLELGDFTRKDWVEYYLIHTQSVKFPAQPDKQRLQQLVKRIAKALSRETQSVLTPEVKQTLELSPMKIIKCGDNVTFTLNENGVLTVSGNGSIWDFWWGDTPWWNKRERITEAQIQNGVTTIGNFAFSGCAALESVTISNSVTTIERRAFSGCVALKSITIPDSVTTIEYRAFSGCVGLTNLTIPNNVTTIGRYAFSDCTELESVTIPDSVATIKNGAFYGCEKLKSVNVPVKADIAPDAFPSTTRVTRRA